jgi:hypothetical protein
VGSSTRGGLGSRHRRDRHQHERPQQLREQPPILKPRIVEVTAVTELQHQQVKGLLLIVDVDAEHLFLLGSHTRRLA